VISTLSTSVSGRSEAFVGTAASSRITDSGSQLPKMV
jgi:hypothetical protein